jgi:hypothetical protein
LDEVFLAGFEKVVPMARFEKVVPMARFEKSFLAAKNTVVHTQYGINLQL